MSEFVYCILYTIVLTVLIKDLSSDVDLEKPLFFSQKIIFFKAIFPDES